MEIFKLFGSIFVDTEEADKSISKTDEKAGGLGKTLLNSAASAGKFALGVGTAAAAGATALMGVATKSAETAKEIDVMSERVGFSKQAYQEWSYIAEQCGTSMDTLQGGITDLAEKMDDAKAGTGEAAEIFDRLGVSVVDSNGNLRDQQAVFEETILALQGMENAAERQALATKLMSTTGEELLPLLNSEAGSMEEMKQKAHELGLVMSDETINAGSEFSGTLREVESMFSAVVTQIGTQVMPVIMALLEWIILNMPMIQEIFSEVFSFISEVVQAAIVIIEALMPTVEKVFSFIGDLWKTMLKPILDNIIEFIVNVFSGNFEGAFKNLINIVKIIWDKLVDIIKNPVNTVIGIINKFVAGIVGGINSVIDAINGMKIDVPDWVTDLTGMKSFGFSIPNVSAREIPMLANGGSVIDPGKVLVGEYGAELLELPAGARVTPLTNSHGDLLGADEVINILRSILTELKLLRSELYETLIDALVNGVEIDWSDRTLARLIRKYVG